MSFPEYDHIRGLLDGLNLPKEVTDWEIELGSDSTDDFAAWITLVISDDVWSEEWLRDTGRNLRHRVSKAVRNSDVSCWPYLTLMTASDFKELQSEKSIK